MTKKLSNKEHLKFLELNFPDIAYEGKYLGAQINTNYFCKIHKKNFTSNYFNLYIQTKKLKKRGSLAVSTCPSCISDAKPKAPETFTTLLTHEDFEEKLDKRFGIMSPKLLSNYVGHNKTIKFVCTKCKTKDTKKAGSLLNESSGCNRCATKDYFVNSVTLEEKESIKFFYSNYLFSVDQISDLTGITQTFVNRVLKEASLLKKNNINSARRRIQNWYRSSTGYKAYNYQARRLTYFVFNRHKEFFKKPRSVDWHLDHQFSVYNGFTHAKGQVDLRLVCHPANLKIISQRQNNIKNRHSAFSLTVLKKKIKEWEEKNKVVEWPEKYLYLTKNSSQPIKGLKVLSFDPGSSNFGVFAGVLGGVTQIEKIKIRYSGMLKNPITSIDKGLDLQAKTFIEEISNLIDKYEPDIILAERFQARGLKGKTVELVNMMLGMIAGLTLEKQEELGKSICLKFITAATWKNALNRETSLDEIYSLVKPKEKHKIDAALIGIYSFPSKPFSIFKRITNEKFINSLLNFKNKEEI